MSTGTKVKFVPTIFVVAALLAGVWILYPGVVENMLNSRGSVLLEVFFKPEQRTGKPPEGRQFPDSVVVELTIAGEGVKFPVTELWSRPIPAIKGQKIILSASQIYGANLGCRIAQDNQEPVMDSKVGPSQVSCVYTVK